MKPCRLDVCEARTCTASAPDTEESVLEAVRRIPRTTRGACSLAVWLPRGGFPQQPRLLPLRVTGVPQLFPDHPVPWWRCPQVVKKRAPSHPMSCPPFCLLSPPISPPHHPCLSPIPSAPPVPSVPSCFSYPPISPFPSPPIPPAPIPSCPLLFLLSPHLLCPPSPSDAPVPSCPL